MRYVLFMLVVIGFSLHSCVKAPSYPIEPHIEFKSVSSSFTYSGYPDTLTFSFTDGDGDIAPDGSSTDTCDLCGLKRGDSTCLHRLSAFNIFVIDNRDTCINTYATADIRPSGKYKGISGDIQVITAVNSHACIQCPCSSGNGFDSVSYTIILKDRAGHLSNLIRTSTIQVVCAP